MADRDKEITEQRHDQRETVINPSGIQYVTPSNELN